MSHAETFIARLTACLVALLVLINGTSTWTAAAQTPQINSPQKQGASENHAISLSPEAAQVAAHIGVASLLERLAGLREALTDDPLMSMELLTLRQEITERVLSTSLDVDSVRAVIDSEIEQIRSIRSDLQSKRDKSQNIINIASIVTGGAFGAVSSALQFKPSSVNLGNGIGVAGGAASVLLSIVGMRKQGGRRSLGDSTPMLAGFFGRPPDAPEASNDYPEEVWSYLNSASPSQPNTGTRRDQLITKWRSEGRIEKDGLPKGERKVQNTSGNVAVVQRLDIKELDDRVTMLLDVRASVSLMKRQLSEILRRLSAAKSNQ